MDSLLLCITMETCFSPFQLRDHIPYSNISWQSFITTVVIPSGRPWTPYILTGLDTKILWGCYGTTRHKFIEWQKLMRWIIRACQQIRVSFRTCSGRILSLLPWNWGVSMKLQSWDFDTETPSVRGLFRLIPTLTATRDPSCPQNHHPQ